jgi:hypothetical protein
MENPMHLSRLAHAAAACLLIGAAAPTHAEALADKAGLQAIRIWEITYATASFDFLPTDPRLDQQLTGASLTAATRDFGQYPGTENYDVFYSDANGHLNSNGSYLTIEGNCTVPYYCFNINEVALVHTGGAMEYANSVVSWAYGRPGSYFDGWHVNAADGNLATYTAMGDTIGLDANARTRITLAFGSVSSVPEPASAALMGAGLLALGWRRRRGAA